MNTGESNTNDIENNVAIGKSAGCYTKANGNVFIGGQAGYRNRTGRNNVIVGNNALGTNWGNGNVFIGPAIESNSSLEFSTGLGFMATPTKSYQMMLGSTYISEVVFCGNKKINFNNDGTVTWETLT